MSFLRPILVFFGLLSFAAKARADDSQTPPYWGALRADTVNMRVGPCEDYRISWVYHRVHLPVKVLRDMQGWRLVQDPAGARGWVNERFISHERTAVIISHGPAEMRSSGNAASTLKWRLLPGVAGKLGACANGWCQFEVDGRAGFVLQSRLWGAGA